MAEEISKSDVSDGLEPPQTRPSSSNLKMADESMSEDQWLYGGDSNSELDKNSANINEKPEGAVSNAEGENIDLPPQPTEVNGEKPDNENPKEPGELPADQDEDESKEATSDTKGEKEKGGDDEEEDDEEDDDSDDNVHVTIGDIKAAPSYPNIIKRGVPLAPGVDKLKPQPGKFSIEEFESIGTINGAPAHEFSIDALEEKPWRKPGADITDYFNYGFNEETWRAYCERQKQMRMHESGVGLGGLGVSSRSVTALPVVNDNSKYSGLNSTVVVGGSRKAGPPPGPRRSGVIDVIGGSGVASRRTTDSPPKENAIQVMTADKRDYGRKNFDMSVPPPCFDGPPPIPPVVPNYPPQYGGDFYNPEVEPYYHPPYEPAQDMQWNNQSSSLPKEPPLQDNMSIKQEPMDKSSRERERERDRHKDRHRHHSRSRSGDRSERRSRKHKSRSRSPGHRSHKKKKSKKSDRSKDGSD